MTNPVSPNLPPKMSIVLLIFLAYITGGIFFPVWFLMRRKWINSLSSREKLGIKTPIFLLIAYQVWVPIYILYNWVPNFQETLSMGSLILFLALVVLGLVLIVLAVVFHIVTAFRVRNILREHTDNLALGIGYSWAATVFSLSGIFSAR